MSFHPTNRGESFVFEILNRQMGLRFTHIHTIHNTHINSSTVEKCQQVLLKCINSAFLPVDGGKQDSIEFKSVALATDMNICENLAANIPNIYGQIWIHRYRESQLYMDGCMDFRKRRSLSLLYWARDIASGLFKPCYRAKESPISVVSSFPNRWHNVRDLVWSRAKERITRQVCPKTAPLQETQNCP